MFTKKYFSPIGEIILESDGESLTGLWFSDSLDARKHSNEFFESDLPIFDQTKKWLDMYFSGIKPNFMIPIKLGEMSPFKKQVFEIMSKIPYGKTITYGEIAKQIARKNGIKKMSAQAVGSAVGSNQICIIIPCHRVMGQNDNITGYGGGIENKIALLKLEGLDVSKYKMPKNKK